MGDRGFPLDENNIDVYLSHTSIGLLLRGGRLLRGGMLKSQIQLVIRIIILDVLESKEDKPKDAPEPETEEPRAGNPKFKTATKARKLVNNLVNFLWVGWSVGRLVGLS